MIHSQGWYIWHTINWLLISASKSDIYSDNVRIFTTVCQIFQYYVYIQKSTWLLVRAVTGEGGYTRHTWLLVRPSIPDIPDYWWRWVYLTYLITGEGGYTWHTWLLMRAGRRVSVICLDSLFQRSSLSFLLCCRTTTNKSNVCKIINKI